MKISPEFILKKANKKIYMKSNSYSKDMKNKSIQFIHMKSLNIMLRNHYIMKHKSTRSERNSWKKNYKEDNKFLGGGFNIGKIIFNFLFLWPTGILNMKITSNFLLNSMIFHLWEMFLWNRKILSSLPLDLQRLEKKFKKWIDRHHGKIFGMYVSKTTSPLKE